MSERIASFMRANGSVAVRDAGGWNESGGARWESNDKLEFPKDEMSSEGGVEITQGCNGTPTKWEVVEIPMFETNCFAAEIDSGGSPRRVGEVGNELRVVFYVRIVI